MQQAQQDVDDAKDAAILAETLYSDLSKKSPDDPALQQMIAAAQSRLDRQQARLDEAQKLVTSGLAPQAYLTPIQEELTSRQIALDLARSRVQSVKDSAALATLRDSGAHLQTAQPPQQAKASEYRDLIRPGMEHYEGDGTFSESRELLPLERAFEKRFDHPLPISAEGETEVHRALGFDHRGRVDVEIHPNQPEGIWLRHYLQSLKIPYYAFTRAIPGKATAAHIHIGPGSTRLHNAD